MRTHVLGALLLATAAMAASPTGFRWARPVTPGAVGPNRLAVDVTLLAGARPLRFDAAGALAGGLEDLRLFRGDGAEVPYLVVAAPVPSRRWESGRVAAILPTDETSGFDVELDDVMRIDRLRLDGIPGPWLKRARLEGSGDRQRWVVLAAEATVFDLPEQGLHRPEIAFEPETVRYLRLTWDDRTSARVARPPAVAVRLTTVAPPPPALLPVAFERRASEPGTSRFRVHLPGPGLPVRALEIDCGGAYLLRTARVTEAAFSGDAVTPRELGAGTLRRVTRDDTVASDLRVPLVAPTEPELELVVDDGDNPPLEVRAVRAELPALPWIYFESSDGAALIAKFGAPDSAAPRYDIEALRAGLADAATVAAAWGERGPVPEAVDLAATSEEASTTGAAVDLARFRHRRAVGPGPAGITALRVDAAVLAHSAALADVRLVAADGRQIPYVVEHLGEPLVVELPAPTVEPAAPGSRAGAPRDTTHRIALPYAGLPEARLVLETSGRVFERRIAVRMERRPVDPRSGPRIDTVRVATWRHADPERAAPALTIGLPPIDTATLLVDVDDGDNEPLPLRSARLLLPAHRLRFVRTSEAPIELAYGAAALPAPRYDLTLLAPRILGAQAVEVEAAPEGAPATGDDAERLDRRVFWAVLAGAVLVLLVVLARLVRMGEGPNAA